jgi:hypothetical protein
MKPVDPPSTLSVWILTSLSSSGMMTTHNASVAVASGVFLAPKGQKAHVFHLEFPMP